MSADIDNQNQYRNVEIEKLICDLFDTVQTINVFELRQILENPDLQSVYAVNTMEGYAQNYKGASIQASIKSLEDTYSIWLGIRGDGNCFYRAVIILYLLQLSSEESIEKLDNFILRINKLNNIKSENGYLKQYSCEQLKQIFLVFLLKVRDMKIKNELRDMMKLINEYNTLPELDFAAIVITRFMIYSTFQENKKHPSFTMFIEEEMGEKIPKILLKYYEYAEDIIIPLAAQTFGVELVVQNLYRESNQGPINTEKLFYQPFSKMEGVEYPQIHVLFTKGHYEGLIANQMIVCQPKFYQFFQYYTPSLIQLFNYYSSIIRELYYQVRIQNKSTFNKSDNAQQLSVQNSNSKLSTRESIQSSLSQTLNENNKFNQETPFQDINNSNMKDTSPSKKACLSQQNNNRLERVEERALNINQSKMKSDIQSETKREVLTENQNNLSGINQSDNQNYQNEQNNNSKQNSEIKTNEQINREISPDKINQQSSNQIDSKPEIRQEKQQELQTKDNEVGEPNSIKNQQLIQQSESNQQSSKLKQDEFNEEKQNQNSQIIKRELKRCLHCKDMKQDYIYVQDATRINSYPYCQQCLQNNLNRMYHRGKWIACENDIYYLDNDNYQQLKEFVEKSFTYKEEVGRYNQIQKKIEIEEFQKNKQREEQQQQTSSSQINSENKSINKNNDNSNIKDKQQNNLNSTAKQLQSNSTNYLLPEPSQEDRFTTPKKQIIQKSNQISNGEDDYSGQKDSNKHIDSNNMDRNGIYNIEQKDIKKYCLYCSCELSSKRELIYGTFGHGYLCELCVEDILQNYDETQKLILINGKCYEYSENMKKRLDQQFYQQKQQQQTRINQSPQKQYPNQTIKNSGKSNQQPNNNDLNFQQPQKAEQNIEFRKNEIQSQPKQQEIQVNQDEEEESKLPEIQQKLQTQQQQQQIQQQPKQEIQKDPNCSNENCQGKARCDVALIIEEGKEEYKEYYCDECLVNKFLIEFENGQEMVMVDNLIYRLGTFAKVILKLEKEQQQKEYIQNQEYHKKIHGTCTICKQNFDKEFESQLICKSCRISQPRPASCNRTALSDQKQYTGIYSNYKPIFQGSQEQKYNNNYLNSNLNNIGLNNRFSAASSANNTSVLNQLNSKQFEVVRPYQPDKNSINNQRIQDNLTYKQELDNKTFQTPEKKAIYSQPLQQDLRPANNYSRNQQPKGEQQNGQQQQQNIINRKYQCYMCKKDQSYPLTKGMCFSCDLLKNRSEKKSYYNQPILNSAQQPTTYYSDRYRVDKYKSSYMDKPLYQNTSTDKYQFSKPNNQQGISNQINGNQNTGYRQV